MKILTPPDASLLPFVDIRRGARDYVRAADIIAAAPQTVCHGPAQFRFHRATTRAGRWTPADTVTDQSLCTASLVFPDGGAARWMFELADPAIPLRALADLDRAALLREAFHDHDGVAAALLDPALLWDQYVLLTRDRWQALFPSGSWSVAAVDVPYWPVPTQRPGAGLHVRMMKQRRRALQVALSIDGVEIGQMLFSITLGSSRHDG